MNPEPLSPPPEEKSSATLARALVTAFLENVPDSVYFKDRQCRFIAASKSKAQRHGLSRVEDMTGKNDSDFFAEIHVRRARAEEEEIMRTGQPMIGRLHKLL